MPELPEVETICRQLRKALGFYMVNPQIHSNPTADSPELADSLWYSKTDGLQEEPVLPANRLESLKIIFPKLRYPLPDLQSLVGRTIINLKRRSRYLLFFFDNQQTLILHLGMTGSFTVLQDPDHYELQKHDIFYYKLADGRGLLYHDIRRFGFADLVPTEQLPTNHFLNHLGVEPLTSDFSTAFLQQHLQQSSKPIKSVIMDNDLVVGVGNIYSNESLFASKILPMKLANSLGTSKIKLLTENIKLVLNQSINANGTTFSNYRDGYGNKGSFVESLMVYGHKGILCPRCHEGTIQRKVIGGRSSFYCPICQK